MVERGVQGLSRTLVVGLNWVMVEEAQMPEGGCFRESNHEMD